MKLTLFYLTSAMIGWAILIGLALTFAGYIPFGKFAAWVFIALVIDVFWWVAVSDRVKA